MLIDDDPLSSDEFKKLFEEAVRKPEKEVAVLKVDTKEDIDRLWPQIRMQHVQIMCPPDLIPYLKSKAANERPYQYLNKK